MLRQQFNSQFLLIFWISIEFIVAEDATAAESTRVVAHTAYSAPGMPTGTMFSGFSGLSLNDSGQTAFFALLQQGTGDVTPDNDQSIWSEGQGALGLLVRRGDEAPGAASGAQFNLLASYPSFNNAGQTAFAATMHLNTGDVVESNNRGMWRKLAAICNSLSARETLQRAHQPVQSSRGSADSTP